MGRESPATRAAARALRDERGFTLIEVLTAMVLSLVIGAAALRAVQSTTKRCMSVSLLNACLTSETVGSLQTYRVVPGSFRECAPAPVSTNAADPASDC